VLTFEVVDSAEHLLIPTVRELFEEYWAELEADVCFQGFAGELAGLPGKYAPPRGVLVVVLDGDSAVACGALREMDQTTCELKRIFVRPSHRGIGLGRRITLDLMDRARHTGYKTVRLDTMRKLGVAQSLYKSLGFKEIEAYYDEPSVEIVFFEMPL